MRKAPKLSSGNKAVQRRKKDHTMNLFPLSFVIIFAFLTSNLNAQQMYSGLSVLNCNNTDETGPSSAFLYTCNGEMRSCKAFLIFRSSSSYDTATTISYLTSSDSSELTRINNIERSMRLPLGKEVIVPVTCSCSSQYYQANTSYVVVTSDTYYIIAYDTFEGLSTCDSLRQRENAYDKSDLAPGSKLEVPLRCACPTSNQIMNGTKFLVTYSVSEDDTILKISERFNVSSKTVAYANGFSEEDPILHQFTTILIPLSAEPLSSQTRIHSPRVVSLPSRPDRRKTKLKKTLIIGVISGIAVAVLCFILFLVLLHHKRNKIAKVCWNMNERKRKLVLPKRILDAIASGVQMLKVIEFKVLKAATEDFSLQNRLSPSVYKGFLHGRTVAFKKMSTNIAKEVKILNKINHFNLIGLYGACEHDGVFYLVYEFMENGSLKEWLSKTNFPEIQSWNHRIRIALDIAKGLHYLHSFANPAYVHKDINSSNILLNRDLRAKIASFSLARSAGRPGTEENGFSSIRCDLGTKGYMAPEYLKACMVTIKMDVYAFGVVLLELITGREVVFMQDGAEAMLSEVVISVMEGRDTEAQLGDLIDPRLQVKHPLGYIMDRNELALRMVKLSVACLEMEPSKRLSMADVVSTLIRIQLDAHEPESFSA